MVQSREQKCSLLDRKSQAGTLQGIVLLASILNDAMLGYDEQAVSSSELGPNPNWHACN